MNTSLLRSDRFIVWIERGSRDPWRRLSVAAPVGLVLAVVLAVFGMPPVDVHGPFHYVGVMDPLCGMTRGSAAMMRGDLAEAWWYNPASPLVILGGVALVARWVAGRVSGRWVCVRVRRTPAVVVAVGTLLVALEINQQIHVDRLL